MNTSMSTRARTEISQLDLGGVRTVVDWAAAEGWNPGLHDAEAFAAADPEGFLGASVDGEPAGAVSAVRYGAGFGFIGLYIVRPEYRTMQLGVGLARHALDRLQGRTVGIDGVVEHQHQYAGLGFATAWRNVRYRGVVPARGDAETGERTRETVIVPAASVSFDELAAYDAAHFGARRDAFLAPWISLPGHTALVSLDAPAPEGAPGITGFGVIRQCREGAKVGPLFADDARAAAALFARLTAGGGDVILDAPEANPAAVALAGRHGMVPVFETARMYLGGDPGLPAGRIFGITSFELG